MAAATALSTAMRVAAAATAVDLIFIEQRARSLYSSPTMLNDHAHEGNNQEHSQKTPAQNEVNKIDAVKRVERLGTPNMELDAPDDHRNNLHSK